MPENIWNKMTEIKFITIKNTVRNHVSIFAINNHNFIQCN